MIPLLYLYFSFNLLLINIKSVAVKALKFVILFLLGALIAGPPIAPSNMQYIRNFPIQQRQVEILGGVDPIMIKFYNS